MVALKPRKQRHSGVCGDCQDSTMQSSNLDFDYNFRLYYHYGVFWRSHRNNRLKRPLRDVFGGITTESKLSMMSQPDSTCNYSLTRRYNRNNRQKTLSGMFLEILQLKTVITRTTHIRASIRKNYTTATT